jgi:hypothetical protein
VDRADPGPGSTYEKGNHGENGDYSEYVHQAMKSRDDEGPGSRSSLGKIFGLITCAKPHGVVIRVNDMAQKSFKFESPKLSPMKPH